MRLKLLKTSRREYLKGLIAKIDETLVELAELERSVDRLSERIDEVQGLINDLPFEVEVDLEEVKDSVNASAGTELLEKVYEQASEYQDILNDYIDGLSESKAEKLRENYEWLEEGLIYSLQYEEGQSLDDVRGILIDAKEMIDDNLPNC